MNKKYWAYSDFEEINATHLATCYKVKGVKIWLRDELCFSREIAEAKIDGVEYFLASQDLGLMMRLPEPDRVFEATESGLNPCTYP